MVFCSVVLVGPDQTDPSKVLLRKNGGYLRTSKTVWAVAQGLMHGDDPATLDVHPKILGAARTLLAPAQGLSVSLAQPRSRIEVSPEKLIDFLARRTLPQSAIVPIVGISLVINIGFILMPQVHAVQVVPIGSALAVAAAMFLIITVHELAHAAMAKHFGCASHKIGIGLFAIFPVFYADVSEIWRLTRARRIIVNCAGIATQSVLGAALIAMEHVSGPSPVVHAIIWTNIASVAVNLVPFAKLDGYWILADALNIPDLQKRAAATIAHVAFNRPTRLKDVNNVRFVNGYAIAAALFYAAIATLTLTAVVEVAQAVYSAPNVRTVIRAAEARPITWLFALYTLAWLGKMAFRIRSIIRK